MSSTNGLIVRFMLGVAVPLAALVMAALISIAWGIFEPLRWVMLLVGVWVLARLGWLPGGFHFFKRPSVDHEYGITPPVCHRCGYDLRASPEHCPECGCPVDRIDATIIRYLMSLRRRDVIDAAMTRKV